jgi:alpha-glucosidase
VWTGSNHDVSRLATRWAEGDPAKVRVALLMLLTLRGTPVLYQGDEIGLVDGDITEDELLDPVGKRFWPYYAGRDPERTPMPWDTTRHGGFTDPSATPWLPMTDPRGANVADQRADPGSVLTMTRQVIAARRRSPDLQLGVYERLVSPDEVWMFRRGASTVVALNLSGTPHEVTVPGTGGTVVVGTDPDRGAAVGGDVLSLGAWEGVVVEGG